MGVRCALRASGGARRTSCSSGSAARSCGSAAGSPVAHQRPGPWRERPPSPRAWYGFGRRCVFTLLSPSPWGRSRASDPCRKAVQRPFEAGQHPLAHRRLVGLAGFARRGQRRCLRAGASPNRAPPHRETTRRMVTQNPSIGKLRSSSRDWAAEEPDHPRVIVEAALAHAVPSMVEAADRPTDLFEQRRS